MLAILLALAAFSYQHDEGFLAELASAETKYYGMEFTIQVTDLDGFQIFNEEAFSAGIDKILEETGISEKRLNAIYLKEAVAKLNPVPDEKSEVSLEPNKVNILPYFEEQKFIMTAQGFLENRIYEDVDMRAKFKFELNAGI